MVWPDLVYQNERSHPVPGKTRTDDQVKFDNDLFGYYRKLVHLPAGEVFTWRCPAVVTGIRFRKIDSPETQELILSRWVSLLAPPHPSDQGEAAAQCLLVLALRLCFRGPVWSRSLILTLALNFMNGGILQTDTLFIHDCWSDRGRCLQNVIRLRTFADRSICG